jgi:hypothetical protein
MNRGGVAVLVGGVMTVLLTLSGCGTNTEPAAGDPTPSTSAATPAQSEPSNQPNPCIGDPVGKQTPPNSGPETDGYLGLSTPEAKQYAAEQNQTIRIAGRDGECFALTMDYRDNRVNIYLENGVVVAAAIG